MKQRKTTIEESSDSLKASLELEDGFGYFKKIAEYVNVTQKYYSKYPAIFSARFQFFLENISIFDFLILFLKLLRIGKSVKPAFSRSEILIFCSSRKPSVQPALDILASEVAKKGFYVSLITPKSYTQIFKKNNSLVFNEIKNFEEYTNRNLSRIELVQLLFKSFKEAVFLKRILKKENNYLYKKLFSQPLEAWWQLFLSNKRLNLISTILSESKPKIILTNGEHLLFGSEFVASNESKNIYKILYFNEHPTSGITPKYCDEVWVWNNTVKNTLSKLAQFKENPLFTITGNAELDSVLKGTDKKSNEENELIKKLKNKKIFLFLSEYDSNSAINTSGITGEAFRWIIETANEYPQWHFIIKKRQYHYNEPLPQEDNIRNKSNISIFSQKITLRDMLKWKNLKVVAATGSQGLYVARGVGKIALRLIISARQQNFKVIDEVSFKIYSPQELIKYLIKLSPEKIDSDFYPYRGQVFKRMTDLILLRLKFPKAYKINAGKNTFY